MITVLGARGFIGSHLVLRLQKNGIPHQALDGRDSLRGKELGNIIYCIGLTADFRQRPLDTVEAHVCKVLDMLRNTTFESCLYLSSTRVYGAALSTAEEAPVSVAASNRDDLYNLSKLMGEALLLHSGLPVKVARLSNIYGADFTSANFLADVIRAAVDEKRVLLQTTLDSEKDYLSIEDAVSALIEIALRGRETLYNVARGANVSNGAILARLAELTGCETQIAPDARRVCFAPINVQRLRAEFDFAPSNLMDDLARLIEQYQKQKMEKTQ